MKKYTRILMSCAAEPWAMEKSKLVTVMNFLRFQASGGKYSAQEVTEKIAPVIQPEAAKPPGNIGLLPIQGVIGEKMNMLDEVSGGTSTELLGRQFRALLNDPGIEAIIMDVNSPGGVARSIEELAQEIYDARGIKPIVAQINTCAASAAYWLAVQADEVIVTPSGQAGSIGIYVVHEDISRMLDMEGITETPIYSGENKVLGNEYEPLSDQARAVAQKRVDALAAVFTRDVARGRGVTPDVVNARFGQGLTFDAPELLSLGMVDRIATMSETLSRFGINLNPVLSKQHQQPALAKADLGKRFEEWSRRVGDDSIPAPKEFEELLRDAGVSKSQRARIASRMHAALRSESGGEQADMSTFDQALQRMEKAVGGFNSTP